MSNRHFPNHDLHFTDPDSGIRASANSADPVAASAMAELAAITRQQRETRARWVEDLRAQGIRLSHELCGWVDQDAQTIIFAYPSHRDKAPAVGDLVAIGDQREWFLVELVGLKKKWSSLASDTWRWERR